MKPGRPQQIKLINEALIRGALASRGESTNADIVADTGLSQTTVNQVLAQMLQAGLIEDAGKRASSGGRRASAWALSPGAWTSLMIAIESDCLYWGIADALGAIVDRGRTPAGANPLKGAISLAGKLKASASRRGTTRCALAVGVPGAVKDGRVITGEFREAWASFDLPALFEGKTGLPTVVENDLNAIALGYARAAASEGAEPHSLAYIHFNGGDCIGSGLVFGGRIHRGASNFSGELGYLPMGDGRVLDEVIAEAADDEDYEEAIVTVLRAVNCMVNPALIVLGGRGFRFGLGPDIRLRFEGSVDRDVRPGLVFVEDSIPHYYSGLAVLAAERALPTVRLVDGRYAS